MLAHERIAKQWPITLVLPARIRHDPIKVVEQAGEQKIVVALSASARHRGSPIFFGEYAMMVSLSPTVSPSSTM